MTNINDRCIAPRHTTSCTGSSIVDARRTLPADIDWRQQLSDYDLLRIDYFRPCLMIKLLPTKK